MSSPFWGLSHEKPFVDNPINRYAIGDRTPGIQTGADGLVTIYLQKDPPGTGKDANWLPAPDGPFDLILQLYIPRKQILDGSWAPRPSTRPPRQAPAGRLRSPPSRRSGSRTKKETRNRRTEITMTMFARAWLPAMLDGWSASGRAPADVW